MSCLARFGRRGAVGFAFTLLSLSPALAADGKPFLMQVGTGGGSAFTFIPNDGGFYTAGSVSIVPKKTGFCAVSASSNMGGAPAPGLVTATISTTQNAAGPWQQYHNYTNSAWSVGMTQVFVITKDVPVTFYFNVSNTSGGGVYSETTRVWTICSAVKEPVLP